MGQTVSQAWLRFGYDCIQALKEKENIFLMARDAYMRASDNMFHNDKAHARRLELLTMYMYSRVYIMGKVLGMIILTSSVPGSPIRFSAAVSLQLCSTGLPVCSTARQ